MRGEFPYSSEQSSSSSEALRVVLVITKGELGGAQTHVLELCRSLISAAHFTVIIGGDDPSPLKKHLDDLGIPTVRITTLRNSLNPLLFFKSIFTLVRVLRDTDADIVHAHSAVAGVVSRLAAKILGLPVVYTVHGFGFKPEAAALVRWYAYLVEAALAAWTTRMVCVSEHEQALARTLPMDPDRVCVVHNALPDIPWRPQAASPTRIIMVARMAVPKRHDLLLEALALMSAHGCVPPVTLLGSGPNEHPLQQRAAELGLSQVDFAGNSEDVPLALSQHSIFVLLSDHEGLPISVIEAMRAGLAIVASRLPGVEELVAHDNSALLVSNRADEVAQALTRLCQDPALCNRLGSAARKRYERAHQPGHAASAMLRIYQEVPLLPTSAWPMTFPKRHRSAMASERSRVQQSQLAWAASGLLLFVLAWQLSKWLESQQLVTLVFSQTVLACLVPYAVASHLLYRGTELPAAERSALVIVTATTPFLMTPLFFALGQEPYSRGAVLLCYALTAGWFYLGWTWFRASRPLRLIVWHEEQPQTLRAQLSEVGMTNARVWHQSLRLLRWPDHWRTNPEHAPAVVAAHGALSDAPTRGMSPADHRVLSSLKLKHVRLYSPQAVAEAISGRIPRDMLNSEWWQPDGDPAYDLIKRAMDATLVLATIPLWVPLALITILLVRLDSPGPVLFVQWRTGLHGRPFRLYKFRSMRHDQASDSPPFAEQDDDRVTRWGRFMRRTRIDEIPQLLNVLRGDMSLIGPRPEQVLLVRQFALEIPSYSHRHLVRPGLTGWAQVHQGYAVGPEETAVKLSYDLYYVSHYSLAMDLLILAKTVGTVVSGRGAR